MRFGLTLGCLVVTAGCLVTGCGSSRPAAQGTMSSAPASSAAPRSSPTSILTQPAPSDSRQSLAGASPTPLSDFESDPAVRTLRAWARQSALAFNDHQAYDNLALTALETTEEAPRTHLAYDEYLGTTFPGPLPLAPRAVRLISPTRRDVDACSLDEGWAVDPTTKFPAKSRLVDAVTFEMVLEDGRWRLDGAKNVKTFSCAKVDVPTQRW